MEIETMEIKAPEDEILNSSCVGNIGSVKDIAEVE